MVDVAGSLLTPLVLEVVEASMVVAADVLDPPAPVVVDPALVSGGV